MTERKPPGVSFESWVDRQIRQAEARGEFTELPGAGKPLPEVTDTPYDELWWIKRKMAREGLSVLPPTLALRKEAEDVLAAIPALPFGAGGTAGRRGHQRQDPRGHVQAAARASARAQAV